MRRIVRRHRNRRVRADQAAHAADVDDHVVPDLHAPVVRQRDQVGQRRAVGLVGRIDLDHHLARRLEVLLERLDLRREEVGLRPGDDHHRGIGRHGALLRQHQLVDPVVLASERRGDGVVTVAIGRAGVALAVSLREVQLLLLSAHDLDDAVGDVLLVVGRDALGAAFVVQDDRPVLADLVLSGRRRLLVDVDVFGGHLLRQILIFLQLVLKPRKLRFLVEHQNLQRRIELHDDVLALIRQAELLVRGEVPAFVLPRADVVDRDENAEHSEHARGRERAVAGLPPREDLHDFAPLTERVRQHADEAGPGEVVRVLLFGRQPEADGDGDEHHRRPEPADETENSIHH